MKLKLLYMGILSVFYNTVIGQNTAPSFQVPPINRIDCPGYVASNIQYQVIDDNTSAANLVVTASAVGAQAVTFSYAQDPTGILRAIDVTPVAPFVQGIVTVTLTLSDVGNPQPNLSTTAVFTINFEDTTKPVITSNGNKFVNSDADQCGALVTVSATATDNCGVGSPVGVRSDAKPLAAPYPVGTTTITWNVTDVNGNAAVAVTQTVTVSDTQKPLITANGDKFVTSNSGCGATAAIVGASAIATDNCTVGTPTGVRSDSKLLTADYPVGTTTITWNVTDANSNAAVAVLQKVVVTDAQFPVIAAAVTLDKTTTVGQCGWTPTLLEVPSATATDNCTVGTPTGKRSDNLALNAQYPLGTTTITWTVTDINGKVAYPATTTVIVKDVTGPTVVVKDIELVLYSGSVTIKPEDVLVSATDACGVNIMSYSLDKSTFTIADVSKSPNTISLTVKDIYGNTTVMPVIVTFPTQIIASQVLTPNGDGINDTWIVENITNNPNSVVRVFNRWGSLVYSAKNYQNDWDGKLNGSNVTVPDGGSYYYQIDLKGTGNVDSEGCLYIISCSDVITPTVITKNITVQLNVSGTVSIVPADVLVSVMDPCVVNVFSSYTLSRDTFTLTDVLASPITIYLTAKDIYGNSTVAPVIVTFTNNLSVDTYKKEKDITIYPNPTTSVLHLQCSNEVIIDKVVVRDLTGKIVVQQAEETSEINVEKLASGIYTIEANSGKEKFKTKFIKE